MKATSPLLLGLLGLSVGYGSEVLAAEDSAEINFTIESNSTHEGIGKHWTVWQFTDPNCETKEKGERIAKKRRNKPIPPVSVPAGRPVTIAFYYVEANFKQNRECSYTWTFTPRAGEKYSSDLVVSQNISCNATIVSSSGEIVQASTPANSCVVGLYGKKVPNGEPAKIGYETYVY